MSHVTTRMTVTGMTCGKCAARVAKALSAVPQVVDAAVDQPSGTATVTHDGSVAVAALVAAVDAAGYAAKPC